MDIDQGTKECIETFDRADYRDSARQAKRLLSARDDYALWQILLISLQRLEETKEARRVASDLLRISDQDPWQKTLVRLSLGKVSLEKAVAKAENEDQRCQALYYAGARSFTQGRLDEALSRFDSCLFVPSECLEHTLAYFQITTLAPRTAQPSLYLLGRLEAILAQARSFFINGQSEDGLGYCHLCAQYAQKYFEKKHPTIYAQRATAVGGLCVAFEKFFESIMFYGDALRINVQTKGMADRAVAASSQKLAEVYIKLKEYTRAEPMLKRILDIYRDTQGEESSSFINCLGVLAHLQFLKGDLDAAGLLLHQALDIIQTNDMLE